MAAKYVYLKMAEHPQVILDLMQYIEGNIRKSQRSQSVGCVFAALALVITGLLFVSGMVLHPLIVLIGLILGLSGIVVGFRNLTQGVYFPENQFDAAYKIFHALRDDTGVKGRVQGTLDLSGARTRSKRVRVARSSGGKSKAYYRDMWFQTKFKLADGNVLRLQFFDKVKTKAGAEVRRNTLCRVKLIFNPQLYQLHAVPPSPQTINRKAPYIKENTLSIESQVNSKNIPTARLLQDIKSLYNYFGVRQGSAVEMPSYTQADRCPKCGAPVEAGASKCEYCGRTTGAGRV